MELYLIPQYVRLAPKIPLRILDFRQLHGPVAYPRTEASLNAPGPCCAPVPNTFFLVFSYLFFLAKPPSLFQFFFPYTPNTIPNTPPLAFNPFFFQINNAP